MKYVRVIAIATIAVAILVTFTLVRRRTHAMQLTTYMADGQALRAGAPVRLAGVDVGFVKSVRVRPELKDNPVEVLMSIDTPYELNIPQDAVVVLETAGVLGEPFPSIQIKNTSGPPVGNHGVLKSTNEPTPSFSEILHKALQNVPCAESGKSPDGPRQFRSPSNTSHPNNPRR